MPIAFPPQELGPDWDWASTLAQEEVIYDVTNLASIGDEFDGSVLNPGLGRGFTTSIAVNLRNPGFDYEDPTVAARPNPVLPLPTFDPQFILQTDWYSSNRAVTGVSRDSTGAVLATCVIHLFNSGSDQLLYAVTSDASGNFSFGNPGTGPFYIAAYKQGSPDVAGTTVNTLMPTVV